MNSPLIYPNSNPPSATDLTDADLVALVRKSYLRPARPGNSRNRAGRVRTALDPGRPEAVGNVAFLRSLINYVAWARRGAKPRSKSGRPVRSEPSAEENIAKGCALALKGIDEKLEWLEEDLPRVNDAATREYYEKKIARLTQAEKILNELAAEARAAPGEKRIDRKIADHEILGAIHQLYGRITGSTKFSDDGPAARFFARVIKQIGWDTMAPGTIRLALHRQRERRKSTK